MARFAYATVYTTSPLQVTTDADPANPIPTRPSSTYTAVVGDRVRIEIFTPLAPRIQARV